LVYQLDGSRQADNAPSAQSCQDTYISQGSSVLRPFRPVLAICR
jgi:hypothetical protein